MKLIYLSFFLFLGWHSAKAQTDFDKAKTDAATQHKLLLVSFSGSDWCLPCIRMHKEIFASDDFKAFALEKLIMVEADFPRLKKNRLSKQQVSQNEALAAMYNKEGKFPFTVLLSPAGKILKQWDGFPDESTTEFIHEIKIIANAGN